MVELKIEWVKLLNFESPINIKLLVCYSFNAESIWTTGYFGKDEKTQHLVFIDDAGGYIDEHRIITFSRLKKPDLT